MAVIPALKTLRQDQEFRARLGYIVGLSCLFAFIIFPTVSWALVYY
jgi:hypothetical protein